ncbi:DNA processing protein DprA [Bifidobacterium sp. SMB2]|uniref:DNA processing protein DprA n=1 Tax=Bifidobacterium saimiriisciurei TaxID=2661627 RepID=A0ABX0C8E6_9BIFI|nr:MULTISPECIES: DNA-processing protein DprA [Bifidobacterium]NEG96062.1 DNA processing protein DprA [Bifidobacterium sp. SMB2]NEH10860.1 DNA processing protein DprA [Bifidobacterium saimiriisciurei]
MTDASTMPLDADTLAMAVLTFCGDGPDALMFAALKGAASPRLLLTLIARTEYAACPAWMIDDGGVPQTAEACGAPATSAVDSQLDRIFATGLTRWGRRADLQAMKNFHTAVARWRQRLSHMRVESFGRLAEQLTAGGDQWLISPSSPHWPKQVNDLAIRSDWAPPLCLWGMGDPSALTSCDAPVAVVGSREVTDYGRYVARNVGLEAARHGHLVVSGGAMGADAAAHWGAIAAQDERVAGDDPDHAGRTVAVFAGGLDHRGPARNMPLFDAIIEHGGALVSEMPPGTIPEARRFLLRNRIIAAMAGTIVIAQARHRSGALNTATWAAEMSRDVYAAPGDIDEPYNTGCNRLVHDGKATLLVSATDIGDICHAGHDPRIRSGTAAETPPIPRGEETEDAAETGETLNRQQRAVVTAIRSCRRRHVAATPDTILDYLRRRHPSWRCSAATVQITLAALEAARIIDMTGGDGIRLVASRTVRGTA